MGWVSKRECDEERLTAAVAGARSKKKRGSKRARQTELKVFLEGGKKENEELRKRLQDLEISLSEAKTKVVELQKANLQMPKIQNENENLKTTNKSLSRDLEQWKTKHQECLAKLKAVTFENTSLKRQIDGLNNQKAKLERDYQKLHLSATLQVQGTPNVKTPKAPQALPSLPLKQKSASFGVPVIPPEGLSGLVH
ncbi:MAG: hypothetical protein ACLP2Y_16655 [Limisphaerales bacterium]